jgi:hypothetical protein
MFYVQRGIVWASNLLIEIAVGLNYMDGMVASRREHRRMGPWSWI